MSLDLTAIADEVRRWEKVKARLDKRLEHLRALLLDYQEEVLDEPLAPAKAPAALVPAPPIPPPARFISEVIQLAPGRAQEVVVPVGDVSGSGFTWEILVGLFPDSSIALTTQELEDGVAKVKAVSKQAIASALKKLLAKGVLVREKNPEGPSKYLYRLTSAGEDWVTSGRPLSLDELPDLPGEAMEE